MTHRLHLLSLVVVLTTMGLVACSTVEPTPIPTSTSTPTATATPSPSPTPAPTATPTQIPTSTPTPKPPDVLFDYMQAVAQLQTGMYDEAIASFGIVLRVLPDFALAYHGRGLAYYRQERIELALEDFNKAIELKPDFPDALRNRGVLYLNRGDLDKAAPDLERAKSLYEKANNYQAAAEVSRMLSQVKP